MSPLARISSFYKPEMSLLWKWRVMAWKLVTLAVPHSKFTEGDDHCKDKLGNINSFLVKSACLGIVLYCSDKHNSDLKLKKINYSEDWVIKIKIPFTQFL